MEPIIGTSSTLPGQPTVEKEGETEKKKRQTKKSRSAINFYNYISNYSRGIVQVTPNVQYSIRDIIEQDYIDRSMMYSVPYYADGEEKLFFSLPYIISDAIYRNTNVDTKDIRVASDNQKAIDWMPLVRGAVSNYLKVNYYGEKINAFRKELIDMGHLLVKEVDNETYIVNLLNVVRPSHILDLQKAGLAERTLLTWTEMLKSKENWKSSWKDIERQKDILDSMQKHTFIVYEWWTEDWYEIKGELKYTKGCIKYLDCNWYDEMVADYPENWIPYIELERFACPDEEKVKSKKTLKELIDSGYLPKGATKQPIYPYEEERLITIPYRWKGMGLYELLRPETRAFNRTLNEKLRYDEMLHKGVLVHTKAPFSSNQKGSGRSVESEIIDRIQNGTMISIKAGEKIDRLNIGSLTADFIASADKWFDIARRKAGVTEMTVAGEEPQYQSASASVLGQQQGKTTFQIVNEQQGLFLERLFTRFKLKSIINEITNEEWVKIIGNPDDLAKMEEPFIENLVNNGINNAAKMGMISPGASSLPPEQIDQVKNAVQTLRGRSGGERMAQIQKGIIEDFDYYARFIISNEGYDKQQMMLSLQEAINTVSQNPMLGLDPTKLIEQKLDIILPQVPIASLRKTPEQLQQDREMAMAAMNPINKANQPKLSPTQGQAKGFGEAVQRKA